MELFTFTLQEKLISTEIIIMEELIHNRSNPLEDQHMSEICRIRSLRKILIVNNNFTEIPTYFGNLTNLVSLEIRVSKLRRIHADLSKLTNLVEIKLPSQPTSDYSLKGNTIIKVCG